MARADWRIKLLSLFVVFVISMGFYANIITIEQNLGTSNILQLQKGDSTSGTQDILANASFENGGENLSWNAIQLSLKIDGAEFPCMVGGMSSVEQSNSTVQSKLNADGKTFTVNIDANSEEAQYLDLFSMRAVGNGSASISFARTDFFLGENVTAIAVEENFDDAVFRDTFVFNESSEQRLEWYSYDFVGHQIMPDLEVYIIEDRGVHFKVQFLDYYNPEGESRHITVLAAPLENTSIPALVDETMVQISPCSILENGDGVWDSSETVSLQENNMALCSGSCSIEIHALFQQVRIPGDRLISLAD
ncbi:MAG: HmuY family protein [Candidatus Poseidoniaceae archaeon]|nr:HmuY family protein [Candidatus Poseidoniaceae archaeon]